MSATFQHWRPAVDAPRASAERGGLMARARNETRYRLRDGEARYVHGCDLTLRTANQHEAWIGFKGQLRAVLERYPELKTLDVLEVMPEAVRRAGAPLLVPRP